MLGVINNDRFLIRGPVRVLYKASAISGTGSASTIEPTNILDILATAAMDGDAMEGWTDFGATKGAVTLTKTRATDYDKVDQLPANIGAHITLVSYQAEVSLAEASEANLQVVWELGGVATNATPTPDEKIVPLSVEESLTERALAFIHKLRDGKLAAWVAFKATLAGVGSPIGFTVEGQAIVPVTFDLFPVLTITDSNDWTTVGKVIIQQAT